MAYVGIQVEDTSASIVDDIVAAVVEVVFGHHIVCDLVFRLQEQKRATVIVDSE